MADEEDRLDAEGRLHQQRPRSPGRASPQGTAEDEVEEKHEFGSREADQAARKLQELGAIVYPAGDKQAVEWGMLAGSLLIPTGQFGPGHVPNLKPCQ